MERNKPSSENILQCCIYVNEYVCIPLKNKLNYSSIVVQVFIYSLLCFATIHEFFICIEVEGIKEYLLKPAVTDF